MLRNLQIVAFPNLPITFFAYMQNHRKFQNVNIISFPKGCSKIEFVPRRESIKASNIMPGI